MQASCSKIATHLDVRHVCRPRLATAGRVRRTRTRNWAVRNDQERERTKPVYQGVYGAWSVTDRDVAEVWMYRVSISIVALSVVGCSAHGLGLDVDTRVLAISGIAALGVALQLIHVYVTPLKRMLQLFWGLGALGYGWIALQSSDAQPLDLILSQPSETLWVGPLGAALTGIAFKEGLCYGKQEAFLLTFLIPALFLSHLFGVDQTVSPVGYVLDAAVCALLSVFAARKYTQKLEDDIGDGSVFAFQRMSEAQQARLLQELAAAKMGSPYDE